VSVALLAAAACAGSAPTPTTRREVSVSWKASKAGTGDDGEDIIGITFRLDGHIVARDQLCCAGVMADQCVAHADGSAMAYIGCAEALTRWEAKLVSGVIVVTRIDTLIEQGDRRTELARVPTAATSLVLMPKSR
jgi:hypothetical protein